VSIEKGQQGRNAEHSQQECCKKGAARAERDVLKDTQRTEK
jgi:hypothetical protein